MKKTQKYSNTITAQPQFPLIIHCPKCKAIPLITINNSITLNYKCNCTSYPTQLAITTLLNDAQQNETALPISQFTCGNIMNSLMNHDTVSSFCIHCDKYLCSICAEVHKTSTSINHVLYNKKLSLFMYCTAHEGNILDNVFIHCNNCNDDLCMKCYNNTIKCVVNKHSLVKRSCSLEQTQIDSIKRNVDEWYNSYIDKLTQSKDTIINALKLQIQKIEDAYTSHKSINDNIYQLLSTLYDNYMQIPQCYTIVKNIKQNFNCLKKNNNIEYTDISNYTSFIEYTTNTNNYFITINVDDNNKQSEISTSDVHIVSSITNNVHNSHSNSNSNSKVSNFIHTNKLSQTIMLDDVSYSNINCSYNNNNPPSLTQIHSLDIGLHDEQPVNCILPLSTGAIAFGLGNGKIELFEISSTYKHLLTMYNFKKAHKSSILDLIELNKGVIASCSSDKKIIIWKIIDLNTFTIEHQISKAHEGKIPRLVYIASKHHLISCSYDCTIKIWDCSNKYSFIYTLNKHIKEVISILYNEHHNILLSASKEGIVRVWKASDYTSIYKLNDTYVYSSRNMITFKRDYVILCTGNKIVVVNVKSYAVEKNFKFDFYGVINCLLSVPNNNDVIALGSEKGHIILLNINNKATSIEVENTHSSWVTCISLLCSSDDDDDVAIVSSSCDGTVKVWK